MERRIGELTDRFVVVRPSLLTNGKAGGGRKVRVGTEERPVVGYMISREDVGVWIFENLVVGGGGEGFVGQKVNITH